VVDKKTVKNFKVNQRLNTHSKGSEVDLLSNSSKMVHMEENARKQTAKQAPEENEVLYSVIAHISLGIVGIAVLSGMIASVKDGKFAHDHSVLSVINGVLTLVVMFSWYYLFLGLGALMGQQAVYEWYTMGMMLFVIASFGGALYSAIIASLGKIPFVPWVYPIANRFFKIDMQKPQS